LHRAARSALLLRAGAFLLLAAPLLASALACWMTNPGGLSDEEMEWTEDAERAAYWATQYAYQTATAQAQGAPQGAPQGPTKAVTQPPPAGGSSNTAGDLRTVGFRNSGSQAYTVQVHEYTPLNATAPAAASNASTAVFPGSTGYLSLPMGTYTWCYWWEIGDVNGDGQMDYVHALDTRPVLLDASDSASTTNAETVELSAPPGMGEVAGVCGQELDLRPYITASQHVDNYYYGGSKIGLAHDTDYVVLRGPITVRYYFRHRLQDGDPWITTEPETVVIRAGETHEFYLQERYGEHPGDWDLFVEMISVDG
jgi:hypothetical protein